MLRFRVLVLIVLLLGPVAVSAQAVRGPRPPGRAAAVAPRGVIVSPLLYPPPLPYAFHYQQDLQKRQHAPRATPFGG
jgi:hypothetical protein